MNELASGINNHRIKPIETKYKGYRFRSRLEARWAVFFDTMGIDWEYETEGYNLPSGPYLPDFWLPHVFKKREGWGQFVEIKPYEINEDALNRCVELSALTKKNVLVFQGYPFKDKYVVVKVSGCHFEPPRIFDDLAFCKDITGAMYLENSNGFTSSPFVVPCPGNNWLSSLQSAYEKAMSARFEHGEEP